MAFSFLLKVGKVLDFLQSLGSEFQILAPLYANLSPDFSALFLENEGISPDHISETHDIFPDQLCAANGAASPSLNSNIPVISRLYMTKPSSQFPHTADFYRC